MNSWLRPLKNDVFARSGRYAIPCQRFMHVVDSQFHACARWVREANAPIRIGRVRGPARSQIAARRFACERKTELIHDKDFAPASRT